MKQSSQQTQSAPARHKDPLGPHRFGALLRLAVLALFSGSGSLVLGEPPLEYNRNIRPILAENCFACHGADSAARKADLRLDQREAAIEFGAIEPGKPEESSVIARINSDDEYEVMPPPKSKKSLTAQQKDTLKRWIAAGAEYQPHWSLILPKRPEPPPVQTKAWVKNAIDQFVLARLEANGLAPAPEADSATLFRRLHLDITGLPPNPADVMAFVADYARRKDVALLEWIDRLMSTPTWGEHRARYWLDAARYGDTHGLHFDNYREMWPYRDWVIRAFNANQPFDRFVVEQIAGDLLPNPTDDQLIATGFQRCNITTNEGGTIDEENLALYAADRVQTFGWVYLGLTTNCGQCHDHKFDPFTMKDYYSLAAFFRNTTQPPKDGNVKDGGGPILVVPAERDRARWKALPGEIAAVAKKRDERKQSARGDYEKWLASVTPESLKEAIAAEGMILHVPLTEGKGNQVAATAPATAKFKASGKVEWVQEGKLGPAPLVKSGSTFDLGNLGDFDKNQSFSYGAWIRPADGNSSGGIIARMDEQGGYRGWDLWQQGQSVAVHIINTWPGNALKVTTRSAVLQPGRWQHVFATYDGSGKIAGIKIYVDGQAEPVNVEADALKPDATIRTSTPLRLGQRSHSQAYAGAIQDVRLYGRQLSAAEVKTIADLAPLQAILAKAPKERTAEQETALYDHYLLTRDPEYAALGKTIATLQAERAAIRARSPITHIQEERKDTPAMAYILARGEYDRPTKQVAAGTPQALHPMPPGAPRTRLGLAQWLVDPANPLTARVTVNRFWYEVFGHGIVATPEDFGVMGAPPTHPELLDWLALEFRESGWNIKGFFKLLLTSATYRQAALTTPEKLEKDRENALLSRGPRFRMDAEMMRDCALAASGLLCRKLYGPPVKPYQPVDIWNIVGLPGGDTRNYVQDQGESLYRRTLYNFWKRMAPPPNLEVLNAPSREVCTVRRERTNTPLQALVTLNDVTFVEAARHLAQRALRATGGAEAPALDYIVQNVLGRKATGRERAILLADRHAFLAYYQSQPQAANDLLAIGASKADEKLDPAQLATWTIVCNQVLNLDEALTK